MLLPSYIIGNVGWMVTTINEMIDAISSVVISKVPIILILDLSDGMMDKVLEMDPSDLTVLDLSNSMTDEVLEMDPSDCLDGQRALESKSQFFFCSPGMCFTIHGCPFLTKTTGYES
jgi:hypothetical protein